MRIEMTNKLEDTDMAIYLYTALKTKGIETVGQIVALTKKQIRLLFNIRIVNSILEFLRIHSLSLAKETYAEGYYWIKLLPRGDWFIYYHNRDGWWLMGDHTLAKSYVAEPYFVGDNIPKPLK